MMMANALLIRSLVRLLDGVCLRSVDLLLVIRDMAILLLRQRLVLGRSGDGLSVIIMGLLVLLVLCVVRGVADGGGIESAGQFGAAHCGDGRM